MSDAVRATHAALLRASEGSTLAPHAVLRHGIRVVPLAMHSTYLPYSLCYVIADARGGVHILDPGAEVEGNLERMAAALAAEGCSWRDVRSILVTHLHSDHMELADALRHRTGAPVLMLAEEQRAIDGFCAAVEADGTSAPSAKLQLEGWGVPRNHIDSIMEALRVLVVRNRLHADRLLHDGEMLDVEGRRLRVLLSPGHTPGHMCLVDEEERIVFTGDHVLPQLTPGLGIGGPSPGNAIDDCLASFSQLAGLDDCEALPGHGYPFRGIAQRVSELAGRHEQRSAEVAAAAEAGGSLWEIAARVRWAGGWGRLRGFLLHSALTQTALHLERLGRADRPTR